MHAAETAVFQMLHRQIRMVWYLSATSDTREGSIILGIGMQCDNAMRQVTEIYYDDVMQ
jgi:hypothetical protein